MFARNTTSNLGDLSKDTKLASPPEDSTSALSWSPVADYLAVASWDSKVRIYDVSKGQGVTAIDLNGPALSCDWSKDGKKVVGAGADKTAQLMDLEANTTVQVAVHDAPIRVVRFFEHPNSNGPMIVTGSWDKTVKYWDIRAPTGAPASSLTLHDRVYAMDVRDTLLVIGDADTNIYIVNLNEPAKVFNARNSPLKCQTRTICCYTDATGFAMGSIEGRGAFQWVSDQDFTARSYTFKCHRNPSTTVQSTTDVYSVNCISTHPKWGTFSTAGSDGTYQFWDRDRKCRLKEYPKVGGQISATGFSFDGSKLAYAVGYDWSQGFMGNRPETPNWIGIHHVLEEDLKPRPPPGRR
ncbi:WD40 repeat-like protein [Mollisia scopiformis]|uniref:WD40 repeat-like protein n=1 Tax=Mollisia scopiformis TaxID=149040 RepID=A0A194XVM3_MOLSC|nr:WD40 repeat-like protein [Mollisia scopiformis]KUJ24380.1 WD40 repeat-like protein [Mollisia scopiformis]